MSTTTTLDPQLIRKCFSRFPSGVAAMAAEVDGEKQVLVASSFTVGVSLDPTLVMFAVQKTSSTWPLLARAERLGISILSDGQGGLCRQLAGKDRAQRFADVDTETTGQGAVRISDATLWFDCSIYAVHPAGDHDVVLCEVHSMEAREDVEPLVFQDSRFRHLAA